MGRSTSYASRPWALEMPSAGRPLTWSLIRELGRRGIGVARLTHAAGLSSTGDPDLDALLPFPERSDIPESKVRAFVEARAHGGSVVAVGAPVWESAPEVAWPDEASSSRAKRRPTSGSGRTSGAG